MSDSTLVCNAGPVIALAKINHLELLHDLGDEVMIPQIVLYEVLAKPGADSARIHNASQTWLKALTPSENSDPIINSAIQKLDAGERQVLELTLSI
jgi:predicted nucleic acid-binding protein